MWAFSILFLVAALLINIPLAITLAICLLIAIVSIPAALALFVVLSCILLNVYAIQQRKKKDE